MHSYMSKLKATTNSIVLFEKTKSINKCMLKGFRKLPDKGIC